MKILILATDHTGTLLYNRLKEEGNECILFNPYHKDNGIAAIRSLANAISLRPAIAIVCSAVFQKESELLRLQGIKVLGGLLLQNTLETNDNILPAFCKAYGLRMLKPTTKILGPISTEVWFSNGKPLYQYIGYIKQDRFLAGDMGPSVDAESIVYWGYSNRDCDIVNRLFDNGLFKFLKEIKYAGPFAIDSLISEDDLYPYVVKIVPRIQAASLVGLLSLLDSPLTLIINQLLHEEKPSILLKDEFSVSVKISQPPYPYIKHEGFVKYITATGPHWMDARKMLIKEAKLLDRNTVQFRIDGGIQGEYYEKFRERIDLN